jgi:choline dehydrogenase
MRLRRRLLLEQQGDRHSIAIPVTPLSRGTITISSNNMSDPPIIDPNWLTSETDIQVAIEAFKRSRAMAEASSIRAIQIEDEVTPVLSVTTDEQIHKYIKESAYMNWRASCTCKLFLYGLILVANSQKARWERLPTQWPLLARKPESLASMVCV